MFLKKKYFENIETNKVNFIHSLNKSLEFWGCKEMHLHGRHRST